MTEPRDIEKDKAIGGRRMKYLGLDITMLKPGMELDKLVADAAGIHFYSNQLHTCPDCGWETESLESSSRYQACWANGDRVTMGDLETVWNFKPSTNIGHAFKALSKPEIMDRYQIGVYPTSSGTWRSRSFMPWRYSSAAQCDTAAEAICKAILLTIMEDKNK